jgi:hypothetical protein
VVGDGAGSGAGWDAWAVVVGDFGLGLEACRVVPTAVFPGD